MKQKIVLIGAFDRYNYGDNLLPILFEMYLTRFAPKLLDRYELRYCAITSSDLSRYKAKPTTSLSEEDLRTNVHSIIAVGGEILAATSSVLILHNSPSRTTKVIVRLLRSFRMKWVADLLCRNKLNLPWEFPYIPKRVDQRTRIALSTVGGRLPQNTSASQHMLAERLRSADYISVRDHRTFASVENITQPKLYPDSGITMGLLVSSDLLTKHLGAKVSAQVRRRYICFQAAPDKIGCTARECAEALHELAALSGFEVLLLPIGYASGHDDHRFLSDLHADPRLKSTLLFNLNIWEIMALIKHSQVFLGTSLHGCVTAMSFGIPCIGLNPKVAKLQAFLQDWAVPPFDKCYYMNEAVSAFTNATQIDRLTLLKQAEKLQALGLQNYHDLLASIGLSYDTDAQDQGNT